MWATFGRPIAGVSCPRAERRPQRAVATRPSGATWPMECTSSAATSAAAASVSTASEQPNVPRHRQPSQWLALFRPPGVGRVEFAGGVFGRIPRLLSGRFDEISCRDGLVCSARANTVKVFMLAAECGYFAFCGFSGGVTVWASFPIHLGQRSSFWSVFMKVALANSSEISWNDPNQLVSAHYQHVSKNCVFF